MHVLCKHTITGKAALKGKYKKYNTEFIGVINRRYTLLNYKKKPIFDEGFESLKAVIRFHHIPKKELKCKMGIGKTEYIKT